MKIKFKKLHPDAVIPKYQTPGASGFDLHAAEDVYIFPGDTGLVKTGLSIEIPLGFELQIRPRSGLSLKTGLRVANSPGTVDSDFRGPIGVIIHNTNPRGGNEDNHIKKGDRIAQGVICAVERAELEEATELSETERGESGFGSTGSK